MVAGNHPSETRATLARRQVEEGPAVRDEVVEVQFRVHAAPLACPQTCMDVQDILRAGRLGYFELVVLQFSFMP